MSQRKTREEKIKDGTYRKDRDMGNADLLPIIAALPVPVTLTNKEVIASYKKHIADLLSINALAYSDLDLLEQGYILLQKIKEVDKQIQKIKIDDEETLAKYICIKKNLLSYYVPIMKSFFVTPTERLKYKTGKQKEKNELDDLIK